jgi:glycerophosphoryl diester phosphodiesterase
LLIVAHRGAHEPDTPGVRPNTLGAFRAAGATADGAELDVRRTADGVLVVLHDPIVAGQVVAEAGRADLPDWVPTLGEALAACAGLRYVDVEIKNAPHEPGFDPGPGLARAVADAVGHETVTCFHLGTVDAARAAGVAKTGWLTLPGYDQLEAVGEAAARGHAAIAPPDAATDEGLVTAAHDHGLEVVVWTVNDPQRVAELARWGVDVCITDRPGLAAAAVAGAR